MAKTINVEFSFFLPHELPDGITVGDVISVPRSHEIYRYFEEHFDVSLLSFSVEKGRVISADIDADDTRSLVLDENAVPTLLEWAQSLPEVRIFLLTEEKPSGFDYASGPVIRRSTLEQSLPAILAVLESQDQFAFVIEEDLSLLRHQAENILLVQEAAEDPATTGVTLDGEPVSQVLLNLLHIRLDRTGFSQAQLERLHEKNTFFVAELVGMPEADFLRIPNTARKTLENTNRYLAQLSAQLRVGMVLEGWRRSSTE